MYLKKILFICLGNICRSPAAEGVMRYLITKGNLQDYVYVDSAGTIDYHTGECADSRMMSRALKRGYDLNPHRARMFSPTHDFKEFDYLITMDDSNYRDIIRLASNSSEKEKIFKVTSFARRFQDKGVPDPYYGGTKEFDYVIDLLEDCCSGLLERVKNEIGHTKEN